MKKVVNRFCRWIVDNSKYIIAILFFIVGVFISFKFIVMTPLNEEQYLYLEDVAKKVYTEGVSDFNLPKDVKVTINSSSILVSDTCHIGKVIATTNNDELIINRDNEGGIFVQIIVGLMLGAILGLGGCFLFIFIGFIILWIKEYIELKLYPAVGRDIDN